MSPLEKAPRSNETLIFPTAEDAGEFRERVENRVNKPRPKKDVRSAVSDELTQEFEKAGEVPSTLHQPWEHTPEEHTEVQSLVNEAFQKDIASALAMARKSGHYPRNIDLLHDVLTNEMYQALVERKANKQPMLVWVITILSITLVTLFLIIIFFALT